MNCAESPFIMTVSITFAIIMYLLFFFTCSLNNADKSLLLYISCFIVIFLSVSKKLICKTKSNTKDFKYSYITNKSPVLILSNIFAAKKPALEAHTASWRYPDKISRDDMFKQILTNHSACNLSSEHKVEAINLNKTVFCFGGKVHKTSSLTKSMEKFILKGHYKKYTNCELMIELLLRIKGFYPKSEIDLLCEAADALPLLDVENKSTGHTFSSEEIKQLISLYPREERSKILLAWDKLASEDEPPILSDFALKKQDQNFKISDLSSRRFEPSESPLTKHEDYLHINNSSPLKINLKESKEVNKINVKQNKGEKNVDFSTAPDFEKNIYCTDMENWEDLDIYRFPSILTLPGKGSKIELISPDSACNKSALSFTKFEQFGGKLKDLKVSKYSKITNASAENDTDLILGEADFIVSIRNKNKQRNKYYLQEIGMVTFLILDGPLKECLLSTGDQVRLGIDILSTRRPPAASILCNKIRLILPFNIPYEKIATNVNTIEIDKPGYQRVELSYFQNGFGSMLNHENSQYECRTGLIEENILFFGKVDFSKLMVKVSVNVLFKKPGVYEPGKMVINVDNCQLDTTCGSYGEIYNLKMHHSSATTVFTTNLDSALNGKETATAGPDDNDHFYEGTTQFYKALEEGAKQAEEDDYLGLEIDDDLFQAHEMADCSLRLPEDVEAPTISHLDKATQNKINNILSEHPNVFATKKNSVGKFLGKTKCDFKIREGAKFFTKQPNMNEEKLNVLITEVNKLEEAGVIEKLSERPEFNSPVFCVGKLSGASTVADVIDGTKKKYEKYRFVLDGRRLSEETLTPCELTLPSIESLIARVEDKAAISVDLSNAFFTLPYPENVQKYTAFSLPHTNQSYVFKRAIMGHSPSSYFLCAALGETFNIKSWEDFKRKHNIKEKVLFTDVSYTYCDDLTILTEAFQGFTKIESALLVFKYALIQLEKFGWLVNASKLNFFGDSFEVYGLKFTKENGARFYTIVDKKLSQFSLWPRPTTPRSLASRLAFFNWYSRVIPSAKILASLLHSFLSTGSLEWTEDLDRAWQILCFALHCQAKIKCPNAEKSYILLTDASVTAGSALLCQPDEYMQNGKKKIRLSTVGCFSRVYSKNLQQAASVHKESFVLVSAMKNFEVMLRSCKKSIIVATDCRSIVYSLRAKNVSEANIANAIFLSSFPNLKLIHLTGSSNKCADLISRLFLGSYPVLKVNKEVLSKIPNNLFKEGEVLTLNFIDEIAKSLKSANFVQIKTSNKDKTPLKYLEHSVFATPFEHEFLTGAINGWEHVDPEHKVWAPFINSKTDRKYITEKEFLRAMKTSQAKQLSDTLKINNLMATPACVSCHTNTEHFLEVIQHSIMEFTNPEVILGTFDTTNGCCYIVQVDKRVISKHQTIFIPFSMFYCNIESEAIKISINNNDLESDIEIMFVGKEKIGFVEGFYIHRSRDYMVLDSILVNVSHGQCRPKVFYGNHFSSMIPFYHLSPNNGIKMPENISNAAKRLVLIIGHLTSRHGQPRMTNKLEGMQLLFLRNLVDSSQKTKCPPIKLYSNYFKQKATLYNTTSDRSRILDKDNDQSSPGHSDDAVTEAESSISNHDIDADDFSEEQYQEEEGEGNEEGIEDEDVSVADINLSEDPVTRDIQSQSLNTFLALTHLMRYRGENAISLFAEIQRKDQEINLLRQKCLENQDKQVGHFYIDKDNVLKRGKACHAGNFKFSTIVIPPYLLKLVTQQVHNQNLHLQDNSMINYLGNIFHCQKMKEIISKARKECAICHFTQRTRRFKYSGEKRKHNTDVPGAILCADLLESLPRTKAGNKHILVVSDLASGLLMAFPQKSTSASETVINLTTCFGLIGHPEVFLSDAGPSFQSQLEDYLHSCGTDHRRLASRSQSQGSAENMVGFLTSLLRGAVFNLSHDKQNNWDVHLGKLVDSINNLGCHGRDNIQHPFSRRSLFFNGIHSSFKRAPNFLKNVESVLKQLKQSRQKHLRDLSNMSRLPNLEIGDVVTVPASKEELQKMGNGRSDKLRPTASDVYMVSKTYKTNDGIVYSVRLHNLTRGGFWSLTANKVSRLSLEDLEEFRLSNRAVSTFTKNLFKKAHKAHPTLLKTGDLLNYEEIENHLQECDPATCEHLNFLAGTWVDNTQNHLIEQENDDNEGAGNTEVDTDHQSPEIENNFGEHEDDYNHIEAEDEEEDVDPDSLDRTGLEESEEEYEEEEDEIEESLPQSRNEEVQTSAQHRGLRVAFDGGAGDVMDLPQQRRDDEQRQRRDQQRVREAGSIQQPPMLNYHRDDQDRGDGRRNRRILATKIYFSQFKNINFYIPEGKQKVNGQILPILRRSQQKVSDLAKKITFDRHVLVVRYDKEISIQRSPFDIHDLNLKEKGRPKRKTVLLK